MSGNQLLKKTVIESIVRRLRPYEIFEKELTIMGSNIDPFTFKEAVSITESLHRSGLLDLKRLGVEIFPLENFRLAIEELKKGTISKAMFRIA